MGALRLYSYSFGRLTGDVYIEYPDCIRRWHARNYKYIIYIKQQKQHLFCHIVWANSTMKINFFEKNGKKICIYKKKVVILHPVFRAP